MKSIDILTVEDTLNVNQTFSLRGSKTYICTFLQAGILDPTVREVVNDFENSVTWSREGTGTYLLESLGAFSTGEDCLCVQICPAYSGDFYAMFFELVDADTLRIYVIDEAGASIEYPSPFRSTIRIDVFQTAL